MQQLLGNVEEEGRKKVLELIGKKTEVMVVSRNNNFPQIHIFLFSRNELKQRDQFNYLGTLISRDRRNKTEIASIVSKNEFPENEIVLTNKCIYPST